MKYLGSKFLETERLELRPQTMQEQKYLWELLMIPEVNRYYLTVPVKFREKLKDWSKQEEYYMIDMEHANDNNVFRWSIFLKETGVCIGRVSCHEAHDEDNEVNDSSIRGVGWIIDPKYKGKGYGTEAAKAMIEYMFDECEIEEIRTGAAIENPGSWRIMEKLGFERLARTKLVQYTYLDTLTEDYTYLLTRDMYKRNILFNHISSPFELLEFMDNYIKYGVLDKDRKYTDWDLEKFQEICMKDWKFRNGRDIAISGVGHCFDQTELERVWFENNDYEYKTIFIFFEHNTKYPYGCHSYLIFKDKVNNNWYWFEHADEKNKGIHIFDNMEDAIVAQMEKHIEYNQKLGFPMNDEVKSWIRIYEFIPPKIGSNNQEYLDHIFSENSKDITLNVLKANNKKR